jgi:hypothetical protein
LPNISLEPRKIEAAVRGVFLDGRQQIMRAVDIRVEGGKFILETIAHETFARPNDSIHRA